MASFADRLKGLRVERIVSREARVERDDEAVVELGERELLGGQAGELPGVLEASDAGPLRVVRTQHDEDHRHGATEVAQALVASSADLAVLALDPSLAEVDFTRALYVDTETTGLGVGSGTLPFLIGCGWFQGRSFVVEQLLLERPGEEAPMLCRLSQRLAEATAIVSYNGKSFDWPLLRARFIMNRVAAPRVPPHLDLLHCARRVYKERLGQVRLVNIEEEVLGFTRNDDLSGALIPQTYLAYLRGHAGPQTLWPIVDHNLRDLVALAALLGEMCRRFRVEREQDGRDQLGFAQVAERADDYERALRLAEAALERDVRGELAPRAHYLTGRLLLERGDLAGAIEAFERSVEAARLVSVDGAQAHLALTKLCEHKLRDYARALVHAAHTTAAEGEAQREKRVERLTRKQARVETAAVALPSSDQSLGGA